MSRNGIAVGRGAALKGVYAFALIAMFAVFALVAVLIGARVYRGVDEASARNDQTRTALSYVINKVRAGDRAGMISVAPVDGRDVLLIGADYSGARYYTAIYFLDGSLQECFYRADRGLNPGLGDALVDAADFSVRMENGLISLDVTDSSGETVSASVFVETAEGAA